MSTTFAHPAAPAYASLAPHYEAFTRAYDHDRWLRGLERIARQLGLTERRVLDVGCGTGKSLRPLLAMGYEGAGCDISPEMLEVAQRLLGDLQLVCADMRFLPDLGRFPWITCINDALNYLLEDDDLEQAIKSMGSLLAPGGLLTFDLNSLSGHRAAFAGTWAVEEPGRFLCWQGRGCADGPGERGATDITIFAEREGRWRHTVSRHEQRWWSDRDVRDAAAAAGLEVAARYGQRRGAVLERDFDESTHPKVVYYLRRPAA